MMADVSKCCVVEASTKSIDEFKRHVWSNHLGELVAPVEAAAAVTATAASSSLTDKKLNARAVVSLVKCTQKTTKTVKNNKGQKSENEDFNLNGIDESQLFERTRRAFYSNKNETMITNNKEMSKGTVAWAEWTIKKVKVMWPCVVTGFEKPNKTVVKYIEFIPENSKYSFKLGPGKVEPMFETKKHFDNLKQTLEAEGVVDRHQFLTCYTRAVQDHLKLVEEKEASRRAATSEDISSQTTTTDSRRGGGDSYRIRDSYRSLEDIQNIISQPVSSSLQQIEKKREEYSKKLWEMMSESECQNFLISIMKNESKCDRHTNYLNADVATRRQMEMRSTGPLKSEQQEKLAALIMKLSKEHFVDKPAHLRNYEYDVLYPEACIWAIRKADRCSYVKAQEKYLLGFTVTEEERMRKKCWEVLNQRSEEQREKTLLSQQSNAAAAADEELADISASLDNSSDKENL